jgi:hypothetical protein
VVLLKNLLTDSNVLSGLRTTACGIGVTLLGILKHDTAPKSSEINWKEW